MIINNKIWQWKKLQVAWKLSGAENKAPVSIVLIHGFGACKEHWRNNHDLIGEIAPCYAIDLIGFGDSSQPNSKTRSEEKSHCNFEYNFANWSKQITSFCESIIKNPVILIGNSIGGVIALKAAKSLNDNCKGVILINCAVRAMDDKRLKEQSSLMQSMRPLLKLLARQRWLSKKVFQTAANPNFIKSILKQAYPSGNNINQELIDLLYKPTQRTGAPEAFHGFINNFNDYLAPDIIKTLDIPIDLIWGNKDPWEPVQEAYSWKDSFKCIRSLEIIDGRGHCPHDEDPENVNPILLKIIQQAI